MLNLKKKKNAILVSVAIYILGLSLIFIQVRLYDYKIQKEREGYYIVVDKDKKDILKIDKKYFLPKEIKKIKFSKKDDEKFYTVEDRNLIEDLISKINIGNFIYDKDILEINEDITIEIVNLSNSLVISLSKDEKNAALTYGNDKFFVTVDDEFYDFIYDFFNKILGEEKVNDD